MMLTPRSLLFVSGDNAARFPKAMASRTDVVCIDLEDAVLSSEKSKAREQVFSYLSSLEAHSEEVARPRLALRINGLRTRDGLLDVLALMTSGIELDYLLLPKVEHGEDLAMLHEWAGARFKALVALIETPLGIERAHEIAGACRQGAAKLAALMLGGADLSQELEANFNWAGLLSARGRLVNAAKANGLQAWDVPHIDMKDLDALRAEALAVVGMGFGCKAAIHPVQIDVIHSVFEPSEVEVRWAQGVLLAHERRQTDSQDKGAFLHEGKMIDAPVLKRVQRIADIAAHASKF